MISVSILGIKEDKITNYKRLDNTNCDFIHLDVMDGKFVENKVDFDFNYKFNKKVDIHLMVENVEEYINKYKKLNPTYITFHIEVEEDIDKLIKILKENNIKVGISIKPNTDINLLTKYLSYVDLILVMSVEPGRGGQKFIENSVNRINYLKKLRDENNYNYLIEVDGGINNKTISNVENADIKVVGSYITNSNNFDKTINELKTLI